MGAAAQRDANAGGKDPQDSVVDISAQHRDDADGGENGRNPLQEASSHAQLG